MSEVTATQENRYRFGSIDKRQIEWVEDQIKLYEEMVESPKGFIIPGDSLSGAYLDFARTVCRRAERKVVDLVRNGTLANQYLLSYFNRLSTLFFILELAENASAGSILRRWRKKSSSMTGTIFNVITIVVGGGLGVFLGKRFPDPLRETVMSCLGLFTLAYGIHLFLKTENSLIVLGSRLMEFCLVNGCRLKKVWKMLAVGWKNVSIIVMMLAVKRDLSRAS